MQLYLHYTDKISVKMVSIRSNNRTQRQQLKKNRQVASKERKKERKILTFFAVTVFVNFEIVCTFFCRLYKLFS